MFFNEILSAFGGYAHFFLKKLQFFSFQMAGKGMSNGYWIRISAGFFNFCVFLLRLYALARLFKPFRASFGPLLTLFVAFFH